MIHDHNDVETTEDEDVAVPTTKRKGKTNLVLLEDIQESKVMQLSDIIGGSDPDVEITLVEETAVSEEKVVEEIDAVENVIVQEVQTISEEVIGVDDDEDEAEIINLDDNDDEFQEVDVQGVVQESEVIVEPEDDKSSSFPFGDIRSEVTSSQHEQSVEKEVADHSFFANLAAEENANSLPSATDEIQNDSTELVDGEKPDNVEANKSNEVQNTEEDVEMVDISESIVSSDRAIAEDLANGTNSDTTRPEPDTELVSDDELPAPAKPKVQGTEEVSDDELPGPKLAELPEDTEVVSEDELTSKNVTDEAAELPPDTEAVSDDELPVASKKTPSKRKANDETYDPSSPTDGSRPEKKAKIEGGEEGEGLILIIIIYEATRVLYYSLSIFV